MPVWRWNTWPWAAMCLNRGALRRSPSPAADVHRRDGGPEGVGEDPQSLRELVTHVEIYRGGQ